MGVQKGELIKMISSIVMRLVFPQRCASLFVAQLQPFVNLHHLRLWNGNDRTGSPQRMHSFFKYKRFLFRYKAIKLIRCCTYATCAIGGLYS